MSKELLLLSQRYQQFILLRTHKQTVCPRVYAELSFSSPVGWVSLCFLRKASATCILERLIECLSREVHCRDNGYETHSMCLSAEHFCRKVTDSARPVSTENHRLCTLLRTNADKFEKEIKSQWSKTPWGGQCFAGGVFCPTSMECVPELDLSKCATDKQFFQRELQKAPWNMNSTREANTRFCTLSMGYASHRVILKQGYNIGQLSAFFSDHTKCGDNQ